MLKIALLQVMPAETIEGNLKKGITACREAKANDADIALFPEMWSNGYCIPSDADALRRFAVSADGDFVKRYQALALELDMAIAISVLESHEPKPLNSSILIDRHGKQVYKYSKIHTCDFDAERMLDSGADFYVADLDTREGPIRVGTMICYDREFPESARILMLKGAELLLVPNACPMEINRLSQLRTRAFENMVAIATCNYPSPKPDCNGHSTLFDGVAYLQEFPGSRDTCVFEANEEEGVFIAELDLVMLRKYRKEEVFGNAYRKPGKYGLLIDETINEPFIRKDRRV
jgi:predicted amidohydrolase